jgi:hypothetical protein
MGLRIIASHLVESCLENEEGLPSSGYLFTLLNLTGLPR